MAIDDNTLYGLTGAQVKELPGKINAVKGMARELTTDDYNYPTDNPTQVATWLLENGLYYAPTGVSVIPAVTSAAQTDIGFIVSGPTSWKTTVTFGPQPWLTTANQYGAVQFSSVVLRQADVVNNLTTSSSVQPLSANQGKVLKDMIDALPTGGGVIELTSADYNYDYGSTGTNNCIALWLLSEGTYSWPTTLRSSVRVTTTETAGDLLADGALVIAASNATLAKVYLYGDGSTTTATGRNILQMYRVNKANGTSNVSGAAITTRELKQSTGNSESDVMSQKATTWMIYNGGNATKVQIGANSAASQNWGVAILGVTSQENTIAIGNAASATAKGAIALGVGSNASTQGVFDVGLSNTSSSIQSANGYNGSAYRLLTGLYDPQNAHDAATKGYVDTAIAGGGVSVFTTNEWNALWA